MCYFTTRWHTAVWSESSRIALVEGKNDEGRLWGEVILDTKVKATPQVMYLSSED